jgi:hypothetical protein
MNPMKPAREAILLLLVMLLTGCASRAWLFRWEGPNQNEVTSFLLSDPRFTDNYTIGFLEFDEEGDIKRPNLRGVEIDPFSTILSDLKRTSGTNKVLLVAYIHGWNNSTRSGDVSHFRTFLRTLARTERLKDYRVYGIYCAWRGDVLPVSLGQIRGSPLFSLATIPSFWSREAAARRVGGVACTDALLRMASASYHHSGSKVIFIGHSFGALVLEQAMAQATLSRMLSPERDGKEIRPPADLIVLLNQASPSLTAKTLIDSFARSKNEGTINTPKPLFVSVTSIADTATGIAYPLARLPGHAWASGRKYDVDPSARTMEVPQEYFLRQTPGHAMWLTSHTIAEADFTAGHSRPFPSSIEANLDAPLVARPGELLFEGEGGRRWILSRVQEISGMRPYNVGPYWIVQAPRSFMANHGDVWNSNVQGLIAAVMARNQM